MYENPKLNRIGNAEEVILGITKDGMDMDANYVPPPWEFAPDADLEEE